MRLKSPLASRQWAPHLAATVLFAALCAVVTYWGLQLFAPRVAIAPAGSLVDWQKAPDLVAASRLFGAPPSAVEAQRAAAVSSNIKVLGVAASPHRGSAVLSIDGKPPKAYLAGEKIEEHSLLVEVRADAVVIEQAGGRVELPAPERPDTAVLSAGPSPSADAGAAAPVPVAPVAPSPPPRPVPPPRAVPPPQPLPPPAPPPQSAPPPAELPLATPPADAPAEPQAEPQAEPPADAPAAEPADPAQPGMPPGIRGTGPGAALARAARARIER